MSCDCLQQIMGKVDNIVQSGSELEQNPHTDQQTVTGLMGKIQTFMFDFDQKLGQRKTALGDAVRLHKLVEKVRVCCLFTGGASCCCKYSRNVVANTLEMS